MNQTDGFWGTPDTTNMFCENKYAVSHLVAEFNNSWSSLVYVAVGLYGVSKTISEGYHHCFVIAFTALAVTGLGSTLFHMTMRFGLQLTDEIPMMLLGLGFFACQSQTHPLLSGTAGVAFNTLVVLFLLAITTAYVYFGVYEIFIHSCTVIYVLTIIIGYASQATQRRTKMCMYSGSGGILAGRIFWEMERAFCGHAPGVSWFHVVWHFLSCAAAYYWILFLIFLREEKCGVASVLKAPKSEAMTKQALDWHYCWRK